MVATRVGKDKSQRSTIKIMNEITYLAASPSSQVLNCIPAPYNCGFVGGGEGKTGKEFISKPGETNNSFMWEFSSGTAHWGNISKMKLHKGKGSPFVVVVAYSVFLLQMHVNHKLLPCKRKFWNPPSPPPPPPARSSPQDMGLAWTSHQPHLARWARGSTIHHPEGDKSFSWSISADSGGNPGQLGETTLTGSRGLPTCHQPRSGQAF